MNPPSKFPSSPELSNEFNAASKNIDMNREQEQTKNHEPSHEEVLDKFQFYKESADPKRADGIIELDHQEKDYIKTAADREKKRPELIKNYAAGIKAGIHDPKKQSLEQFTANEHQIDQERRNEYYQQAAKTYEEHAAHRDLEYRALVEDTVLRSRELDREREGNER